MKKSLFWFIFILRPLSFSKTTTEGPMLLTSHVPTRTRAVPLGLVLAVVPVLLLAGGPGRCQAWPWCCPTYHHHAEGPPCICFHPECGRPVCPPCDSEFYGYYPTCWRAWNVCPNCPHRDPPWVPQAPVPPLAMNASPTMPQGVYQPPQQGIPQGTPPGMAPPVEGEMPGMEEAPGPMLIPGTEPAQPAIPDSPQPRLKPTSLSSRPRLGAPEPIPEFRPHAQAWDSVLPAMYIQTQPR
jgi:hypothetical protein